MQRTAFAVVSAYDQVVGDRLMYGVVLNDLDLGELPDEGEDVGGGWMLRRAADQELEQLRPELIRYAAASPGIRWPNQEYTISASGSGHSFEPIKDPADLRYSVVIPSGDDRTSGSNLAEALRIAEAELWVELWCARKPAGSDGPEFSIGGSPGQCAQFFNRMTPTQDPARLDAGDIRRVVDQRVQFDDAEFVGVARALQLFRQIDELPSHSSQKLLGHLSVLESLLVHPPSPHDPVDSITRQLRRNLTLIDHRLEGYPHLELDDFGDAMPDKVVGQLYSYRSAIAHGGDGAKELEWFENRRPSRWTNWWPRTWLNEHVRLITRRVLYAALREPRLVTDLRG